MTTDAAPAFPPAAASTPVPAPVPTKRRKSGWRRVLGSIWLQLVVAFVVAGFVLSFVAKPYWVPSGSMEDTLQPGDRILVNRLAFNGSEPVRGDIVVFDADDRWDSAPPAETNLLQTVLQWLGEVTGFGPSGPHTLIKRVIGAPGQTVECCSSAGSVIVDHDALHETYISNDFPFEPGELDCTTTPRSQRCFAEVTVPDDSYLMLGDNRVNSSDSAARCRELSATGPGTPLIRDDCWRWASRDGIVGEAVVILWPIGRWTVF